MGALQYDQKSGSIEITYGGRENPFMGIDSSAPDPYIGIGALTKNSSNVICIDNTLRGINWQILTNTDGPGIFVGMGDLLGVAFGVYYSSTTGLVTVVSFPNFPSLTGSFTVGVCPIPNYSVIVPTQTPKSNSLCWKNINGVCFFSFAGCPYILQHNNVSVAILTDYLGCAFLNELNGRLVAADIFQFTQAQTSTSVEETISAGANPSDLSFNSSQYEFNSGLLRTQGSVGPGILTDYVIATGFGFSIPTGATIVGITATLTWAGQFAGTGVIKNVSLYQTSAQIGTPITANDANTASFGPNTYGTDATDVWGAALTPTIVNDPTFGVGFQIETAEAMASDRSFLSTWSITIYYTFNSGTGTIQEFPYQFAWSAATQQYGQFDPLDANGLVTGAGDNNLPDVEDTITGYFNIGPTGYILRSQGITEVSPLNSGVDPFDFNHLWASHKGIGTIYPTSVAQYGSIGAFLSDTGMYTLGYEGINIIDNKAKSAIYGELIFGDSANILAAGAGPLQIDGENFLAYAIAAQNPTTHLVTIYIFNFNTKEWFRFIQSTQQLESIAFVAVNQVVSSTGINTLYLIEALPRAPITGNQIFQVGQMNVVSGLNTATGNATIIFSAEEIKILRDITIDAILVYYNAKETTSGSLTGTFSIAGVAENVNFTVIADATATFDGTWRYIKLVPSTAIALTDNTPQLTIVLESTETAIDPFYIGKVVLFGSIDSTQRPI